MNMNAWLKQMEDKWQESAAVAKTGGFERHPDGRYTTRLASWELTEDSNGNPQHAAIFTIVAGDLVGESLYSYNGLSHERSLEFLARDLARFGYDPETFSIRQLPKILAELTKKKPYVKVQAKTKGEYQNIYIQKVMEDDYDPEDEGGYVPEDDDDDDAPVAPSRAERRATPAKRAAAAAAPSPAKRKRTPEPEPEDDEEDEDEEDEDEDEEEEDEEEEEAPPVRSVRKTAPAPAKTAKPVGKATRGAPTPPAPVAKKAKRAPEPEPEVRELEIGTKVSFMRRGVETEGVVMEIDEENELVHVKVGSKQYPVDAAEIEIL